jgi:hypothetical protein
MLPKLKHPSYEVTIPSNKKIYSFRPYTVREQKILLMMQESNSIEELSKTITDLIESCSTNNFSTKNLAYFDIEYLFLKIRAKSVGETSNLSFKCNNLIGEDICGNVNKIEVSLEDVEVDFSKVVSKEINISDNLVINLRYPNIKSAKYLEEYNITRNIDKLIAAISEDLDTIVDENKVYDEYTQDELREFLLGLDLTSFKSILEFYLSVPKLRKVINFKCSSCGYEEEVTLSGISDFFE